MNKGAIRDLIVYILVTDAVLTGCSPSSATSSPADNRSPEVVPSAPPIGTSAVGACKLPTVVAPTLPVGLPDYTDLDPTTGLHITGQRQVIDLASYRLMVTGKVDHPLSMTYDELRCMPKTQARLTLICPGTFEDSATWAGASIVSVLEQAHVQAGATELDLHSADGYVVTVSLAEASSANNFLAYELEGKPLPILHGFPVRAVFPGQEGSRWLKWLTQIRVR